MPSGISPVYSKIEIDTVLLTYWLLVLVFKFLANKLQHSCIHKDKGLGGKPIFCLSICANFPGEPEPTSPFSL